MVLLLLFSLLLVPLVLLDRRRRGRRTPPFSVLVVAGSGEWRLPPAGESGALELPLQILGTTSPGMQRDEQLAQRWPSTMVHAGSCSRGCVCEEPVPRPRHGSSCGAAGPGRVSSGPPPALGCFESLLGVSPQSRWKHRKRWCSDLCSCSAWLEVAEGAAGRGVPKPGTPLTHVALCDLM